MAMSAIFILAMLFHQQPGSQLFRESRDVAISFEAQGGADLLSDKVSLAAVDPNPAPPSAEAAAYLHSALQLLRKHHVNRAKADWVKIERDAREEIGGAVTPADTYAAIRGVLGALGEKHTMLVSPDVVRSRMQGRSATGAPVAIPMPTFERVGGRFGAVRVPGHIGPPEAGLRYTQALRSALTEMDAQGVCGWIVDLRGNTGGNMWPMMNGLDPLLGRAPFGSFRNPSGEVSYWSRTLQGISSGPGGEGSPSFTLKSADRPVAILIDDRTKSSGEMVAIGFLGRSGVRTFGTRSGGYTTANRPFPMPDGALLVITTSSVQDRTGRDYPDGIAPDESSDPATADAAALRWLQSQPCSTPVRTGE
jgi:hypothetical protein